MRVLMNVMAKWLILGMKTRVSQTRISLHSLNTKHAAEEQAEPDTEVHGQTDQMLNQNMPVPVNAHDAFDMDLRPNRITKLTKRSVRQSKNSLPK